jgi:hypothetical protein
MVGVETIRILRRAKVPYLTGFVIHCEIVEEATAD